jgi:anti-sigma factor RsiW
MNHPSYETLLFTDKPLDDDQQKQLNAHLSECQSCKELSEAIMQVDELFVNADSPRPMEGFTQRWHYRMQLYHQQKQNKSIWFLTIGAFATANIIFLILTLLNVIHFNWSYQLSQSIATISLFAARLRNLFFAAQNLVRAFPVLIPFSIILAAGCLFATSILMGTGFVSMIKQFQSKSKGV